MLTSTPPPDMDEDFNFGEMIAARKREVGERLERLGVFRDLDADQRNRLTDIVGQLSAGYGLWKDYPEAEKRLRIDAKSGRGQRSKFKKKVQKALTAVDDALKYASKLSGGANPNELFARSLRGWGVPRLREAKKALEAIRMGVSITPVSDRLTPPGRSLFSNPGSEARDALLGFFIDTCSIGWRNADRRTALIGKALWGWRVAIDDEWSAGERGAPGASAIRKHRTRRIRRDTSRKTRQ